MPAPLREHAGEDFEEVEEGRVGFTEAARLLPLSFFIGSFLFLAGGGGDFVADDVEEGDEGGEGRVGFTAARFLPLAFF